jgi:hypothetical protein
VKAFGRVIVAAASIAVLAWLAWRWLSAPQGPSTGAARPDSASVGFRAALLHFAAPSGDSLVIEPREILEASSLHERVGALIAELERGPRADGARVIPGGTTLQHAYLDERGTLTLDLSRAFRERFQGGSGAEYLAVGAVVRTVAANLPEVRRVRLACDGQPLPTLGHLPLDRPIELAGRP